MNISQKLPRPVNRVVELEAEFAEARRALTPDLQQKLIEAGVPERCLSLIGVVRAIVDKSGFAQPHDEGDQRWAIASRVPANSLGDLEDENPWTSVLIGELVDIVYIDAAGNVAVRTGARPFVGVIHPQLHGMDVPDVLIHRTVFGWLRSGCAGIATLTRDRERLRWLLSSIQKPVAEDEEHARELRSLRWQPPVAIRSRDSGDGVAA